MQRLMLQCKMSTIKKLDHQNTKRANNVFFKNWMNA